jgi:hypothetical protein
MSGSITVPGLSARRRRPESFFALAMLLAALSACVSFRTNIPSEPEHIVAFLALVPQVNEAGDFDHDISSQPVQPGADGVCALIKIRHILRPVSLAWRWYAPDGSLARVSPPVTVNARQTELEHALAWDRLAGSVFSGRPGEWQVVVCANDRFLASARFTVPADPRAASVQPPG